MAQVTANQLVSRVISRIEMDGGAPPPFKRLMLTERMKLQYAIRARDADAVREQMAEVIQVANDWGVDLKLEPFETYDH